MKHIYIDGELELIDSAVYFNRLYQKNYTLTLNATGSSLDDPDQHFIENYGCDSLRNFNGYCNPELTALMAAQSRERDTEKRRGIVREIERKLVEDTVRPIISHAVAAGCLQPQVKGLTIMTNSIYNGWRFEDVWLDHRSRPATPKHTRHEAAWHATYRRNTGPLVERVIAVLIDEAVMSRGTRTLIGIVVIELLLAGGWIWLHGMALASPHATKDSTRVIGEVFGGAMGLLLARRRCSISWQEGTTGERCPSAIAFGPDCWSGSGCDRSSA